jgi:hypothetical protein
MQQWKAAAMEIISKVAKQVADSFLRYFPTEQRHRMPLSAQRWANYWRGVE